MATNAEVENDAAQSETTADVDAEQAVENVRDAVEALQSGLELLADADADELDNGTLADVYADLRDAEKGAEEARKDDVGEVLESRVDVGETVEGSTASVQIVEGHNKYVKDEQAALEAVDAAGVGMLEVLSINASDLANVADEHDIEEAAEQVGKYTYTYGRVRR